MTGSVYAQFDKPVHMYRGETMAGNISDESVHDPSRGFAGGYYIQTISLGPAFMASFVEPGAWGPSFTRLLDAYENTAGCWLVGEDMPQESNAVTLDATVTDQHGLPVDVLGSPNDLAMREHATAGPSAVQGRRRGGHAPHAIPSAPNLGTCHERRPEDGSWTASSGARRAEPVRLGRLAVHHRRRSDGADDPWRSRSVRPAHRRVARRHRLIGAGQVGQAAPSLRSRQISTGIEERYRSNLPMTVSMPDHDRPTLREVTR